MWLRVILVALLLSPCGVAQGDGLQLNVITGAGGTVRFGATAPVHALITNSGPGVSAVVTVNWIDSVETTPIVTEFQAVELPRNSSKRITVYSEPRRWSSHVRVVLREYESGEDPRSGRVLAEFTEPVNVLDPEIPLLGVVGPAVSGPPPPRDEEGRERGERFYFSPDYLPNDAAGWEMCDALLYTPRTDSTPAAAELRALRDYVFFGGDLVIHASEPSPVFGSPGFNGFVPYVPSGQEQRFISRFGASIITSVGRVEQGEVLLREGDTPLLIQRAYGLGTVTMIAFDVGAPAFNRSSEADALWRRILPELYVVPSEQSLSYQAKSDYFTEYAINAVTQTPDVRIQLLVVVLLIGLYALAVGPGDYLLAKRYKRPMLTWITFPSMVLVFTSVAFLGARVWVGGQEELHGHRSVTWFPEGALYNEALGYFASATRNYKIGTESDEMLRPLTLSMDTPNFTLINNETGERVQRIPTWTARSFTRSYRRDHAGAPVSFTIEQTNSTYTLTVENGGEIPIRPVAFTADGRHFPIHESELEIIPPGEHGEVELVFVRGGQSRAAIGGAIELWNDDLTRSPRFRAWDHRPLAHRRDAVLTYTVVEPDPLTLTIDQRTVAADSTTEAHHVVQRRASSVTEQPLSGGETH